MNVMAHIGTAREENVPEIRATLIEQQKALIAGRRHAQMFPNGTDALPLPEGFQKVRTARGLFHYDPKHLTALQVVQASIVGEENTILGLGPYSKAQVIAADGWPVAVVERTEAGLEVVAALASPSWASEVAADMRTRAAPGNTVKIEMPETVVGERNGDEHGC